MMTIQKKIIFKMVCTVFAYGIAGNLAFADGFDTFSKQKELIRSVVVDVGEAEKVDAPINNSFAGDTIKLAGRCFKPLRYLGSWGLGKKAALLLVDQSKAVKIALLENGIGSIKVDVIPVTEALCQANYSDDLSSDPKKALEQLRQRQEALREQYERLRKQQQ